MPMVIALVEKRLGSMILKIVPCKAIRPPTAATMFLGLSKIVLSMTSLDVSGFSEGEGVRAFSAISTPKELLTI